jgi:6-phosphogluconolactonase
LTLLIAASALWGLVAGRASAADYFVFFGSHRQGTGIGFSIAHFDSDTGKLSAPRFALQTPAPAFFVIHPDGRHIYSCNSGNTASVSAYLFDPATSILKLVNTKPSGGGDPSYISLDPDGRHVLVANYQGGSLSVFAIQQDGSLGDRTAFIQNTGHGVNPTRQTQPHAHSIRVDPTGHFALAPDLGLDKVFVFRYDARAGSLTPNDPPFAATPPGSGPRHLTFHPNGRWVYVIHEITGIITQFDWDSEKGLLTPLQTISAVPADFKGINTSAEIAIHPNGRFLYATDRGPNCLAVFAIDARSGNLSLIEDVPTQGKTPRNFAFDPTGRWLLVTNHDSNNAVVFAVDPTTGRLTQAGPPVAVPYPFCERFLAVP